MTAGSRLPLPGKDDLPEEYRVYLSEEYRGEQHVFQVLGNHPPLLAALFEYSTALSAGIPRREKELLVLSFARAAGSEYIWHQHVDRTLDDLFTGDEIRAIGRGDDGPFEGRERAVLAYGRAGGRGEVTDEVHAQLAAHYPTDQVVNVAALVGFYDGLETFIDLTGIPLEEDFVGWQPAG